MKLFYCVIYILLQSCYSYAQAGYGFEAGIGMSTLRFAPDAGFTKAAKFPIPSGKIGGIFDIGINKHVYFQTGICFSAKGQKRTFSFYQSDSLNEAAEQTLRLYYFDLPVMLCFKAKIQGKGRLMAGAGAAFSYLAGGTNHLKSTGKYNGSPYNTVIDEKAAPGKPLNAFDLGLNVFAGYELPTGLFFRIYYTAGVNDLGQGSEIDKNRMWGIAAGYIFGKGKNINKEKDELIDKGE